MADVRVWAPHARTVALSSNGRLYEMTRCEMGWWSLAAPWMAHGCDYAFHLDGQGPMPDPCSAWQPQGVHGPSRWLDHGKFVWNDGGWQQRPLGSAVIYEMHIGAFTPEGTFDGAISQLDGLADLGITHIELMPVAAFSGSRGWGYDGVALYAPHQVYGGPDGLKRLVDACHQRGLAILLDVVYNHLGPSGNYLGRYGPYFTERYTTPWGMAVNLDGAQSDPVRRFFIENALMWLRDYHIDGLRIDAIHAFADMSAIHFLEQLAAEVRQLEAHLERHFVLIAESDLNDPRAVLPPRAGGYGIDAQWNEDFHHALHAVLTGERQGYYRDFGRLADLAKVLTQGWVYDGAYSVYRRRTHGRPATGLSGHRFVGCLQNHDQIGNRAQGERASRLMPLGRLKIGAALLLTAPFVPMIFQGEEWGAMTPFLYFTNHEDPELGEAVRHGRRKEFAAFGWDPGQIPDPQDETSFLSSKLDWNEAVRSPHSDILEWHRELIRLRRRFSELTDGRLDGTIVKFDEMAGWLVMSRGRVVVTCNLADTVQNLPFPRFAEKIPLLLSDTGIIAQDDRIVLPANTVAIWADKEACALSRQNTRLKENEP
ncbi:MAG: malto-oligosyltrehalose trehalohydrolase [Desulfobacterales bacterium]|nr:malto-oligosyltrehalose trehalohydrolase [Desulfobacterales bacterium]